MTIDCISLHQPWAFWISQGWKTIETRTHGRYVTLLGKRIGIHAAMTWDKNAIDAARPYLEPWQIEATETMVRTGGYITCLADVQAVNWIATNQEAVSKAALIDCVNGEMRYGLWLENIQRLAFPETKITGRQGVFKVEVEL